MTAYRRDLWLDHWPVVADGMDLRQWLLAITCGHSLNFSDDGERVVGGHWMCAYTGESITDPHVMDIDHVIPLEYVHALAFDMSKPAWRRAFATDTRNLQVVSRRVNDQKGDRSISQWVPQSPVASVRYALLWKALMVTYRRVPWPDAEWHACDTLIGASRHTHVPKFRCA